MSFLTPKGYTYCVREKGFTYRQAGVDIEASERAVEGIKSLVKRTFDENVLSQLGGFSGFYSIPQEYKEPVLVSATDGVGTKIVLAQEMNKHNTVGIDLVAMCVNDVLTSGARPLFFLDYIACGKLDISVFKSIIEGIAAGCEEAGCTLLGGETAEMPGFYASSQYDLAGFCVGIVEKSKIINGSSIKKGDALIGLASNGVHSNGFSLVRKILKEKQIPLNEKPDNLARPLEEELLIPTKIYVKAVHSILEKIEVKGMAHITGGGIPGNLPRIFPSGLGAEIEKSSWTRPPIFELLQKWGEVEEEEMYKVFNMGIGFILVVDYSQGEKALSLLEELGEKAFLIGKVVEGEGVKFLS